MIEKTLATFRIALSTWEQFKEKASVFNMTASALLVQFVETYLSEDQSHESEEEQEPLKKESANDDVRYLTDIDNAVGQYLDINIDNVLKQYLDTNIDNAVGQYLDKNTAAINTNIDSMVKQYLDTNIDNVLKQYLIEKESSSPRLDSLDSNIDKSIDKTGKPCIDIGIDRNETKEPDFIDNPQNTEGYDPLDRNTAENHSIDNNIDRLTNSIDSPNGIDKSIDKSIDPKPCIDKPIDVSIDCPYGLVVIDNSQNTAEGSIDTNESITDDELIQGKTYSDAIALIKRMVLRERRTQREAMDYLNSSGYPTANGVGEWTPVKVSREVKKLRRKPTPLL